MQFFKSPLLSDSENHMVMEMLPPKWESHCTTVAQVFTCLPLQTQWVKKDTGMMCLIKDHTKKSYYFRLFNMKERRIVWEQEFYEEIVLNRTSPFFFMFEADDSVIGISFVSADECDNVVRFVELWKQKRAHTQNVRMQRASRIINTSDSNPQKKSKSKKDKGKKKITADMIGTPTNFRQVAHFDSSTAWKMVPKDVPQNQSRVPQQPVMIQRGPEVIDTRMGSPSLPRQAPSIPLQSPKQNRMNPHQYPQVPQNIAPHQPYPQVQQNFNRQQYPQQFQQIVGPQRGNHYVRTPNNINPKMIPMSGQQGYPVIIAQQTSLPSPYHPPNPYPNNQISRSVPASPNFNQSKHNQVCRPAPPPFVSPSPVPPPPPPAMILETSSMEQIHNPRDEVMRAISSGIHTLKPVDQRELSNKPMKSSSENSIATILQTRIDQINNANNSSSDDDTEYESDDDEWLE